MADGGFSQVAMARNLPPLDLPQGIPANGQDNTY